MKAKLVIPREQANRDVDEVVAYYLNEAGEAVALGFIDALEKAYGHIGLHPATGSPRATPTSSTCRACVHGL